LHVSNKLCDSYYGDAAFRVEGGETSDFMIWAEQAWKGLHI